MLAGAQRTGPRLRPWAQRPGSAALPTAVPPWGTRARPVTQRRASERLSQRNDNLFAHESCALSVTAALSETARSRRHQRALRPGRPLRGGLLSDRRGRTPGPCGGFLGLSSRR